MQSWLKKIEILLVLYNLGHLACTIAYMAARHFPFEERPERLYDRLCGESLFLLLRHELKELIELRRVVQVVLAHLNESSSSYQY